MANAIAQSRLGNKSIFPAAQWFVLWAAEHIRSQYRQGALSWDFVLSPLGLTTEQSAIQDLTQTGLRLWQRQVRKRPSDQASLYLFSLLAEGGLPDAMLARDSGYQSAVLTLVAALERDRIRDPAAALILAERAARRLPQVFSNAQTAQLLAELGLAITALRDEIPAATESDAQERWLDLNRPGWTDTLPLRLSDASREAILRPALHMSVALRPDDQVQVQRLLRRRSDGSGWLGMVQLAKGGLLPHALIPFAPPGKILRLTSELGLVMRASPDSNHGGEAGWRLDPIGNGLTALDPSEALVFTVNLDGRALGEVVLDPGLAEPELSPSFWAEAPGGESLHPLARPRCRGPHLWLLAPKGAVPAPGSDVTVLENAPGPTGGHLWQIAGRGTVSLGERKFTIVTDGDDEADDEAMLHRMIVMGRLLPQWRAKRRLPVYLGKPQAMGARPGGQLHNLGRQAREIAMPRLLGGSLLLWESTGEASGIDTLAALQYISLPETFAAHMREIRPGEIEAHVTGIPPGWEVSVVAAGHRVAAQRHGPARIARLNCGDSAAGEVEIALSDPTSGCRVEMVRIWPARDPLLVSPGGEGLRVDRLLALSSVAGGWRGQLPEQGGAIQLRIDRTDRRVAFPAAGLVRLASLGGVFGQALALSGADGRVNLRLAAGTETPRLKVGRYDWETDPRRASLMTEPCRLTALTTSPPHELRVIETGPDFSLDAWLGDLDAVWLVQGASDKGVMRAFPWSRQRQPRSTRDQRIALYATEMRDLLRAPAAEGWDHFTRLIILGRQGGDCGALDQVQALGQVPAFALALLLRSSDPAAILDLENEAPLWWPLTRIADWKSALLHLRDGQMTPLIASGFSATEAQGMVLQGLARRLGRIVELRRELTGHVARTLAVLGLPRGVIGAAGEVIPLDAARPAELQQNIARRLVARRPKVPQGSGRLMPQKLVLPQGFDQSFAPLLAAPLVAAEVVTGLRAPLAPEDVLDLLALRFADPDGFDEALSIAVIAAPTPQQRPK